jgi:hypothetical protein
VSWVRTSVQVAFFSQFFTFSPSSSFRLEIALKMRAEHLELKQKSTSGESVGWLICVCVWIVDLCVGVNMIASQIA